MKRGETKVVARNKKAFYEYEILDRVEAGIVLQGTEVKSIRAGRVNLQDGFARVKGTEVWLENCNVSPYSHGNIANHEPMRPRKLLLHRREINRLLGRTIKKGFTIVPLSMYLKSGKVKVEIALARGKQLHDKRETSRRKTIDKEVEAELKRRR